MPLFSIIGHDVEDSSKQRQQTRAEHIARLQALENEGRLILAGPSPKNHDNLDEGMLGSLMIVEFETLEAVQEWCQDEPYLRESVYSHVDIKPFIQALPSV